MSEHRGEEVKAIAKLIGLTLESDSRSALDHTIRKLVVAEVVTNYTLIDDLMNDIIVDYFIPLNLSSERDFEARRILQHFILDETYPLKKLSLIDQFEAIPKVVRKSLQRINDTRNALAHSFIPEQRKEHARKKMVAYQGANLFSEAGLTEFLKDAIVVINHLNDIAFTKGKIAALLDNSDRTENT